MKIIRFRPINKYSLQCLQQQQNWSSNPANFNDPFEFSLANSHHGFSGHEGNYNNEEQRLFNRYRELKENLGVVSYSKGSEEFNILLWSHYADFHREMCLVFEVSNKNLDSIDEVRYRKPLLPEAKIEKSFDDNLEKFKDVILSKSKVWRYEQELRQITKGSERYLEYPGNLIEIIFGCNCNLGDMKLVKSILDGINQNPILSRMSMNGRTYSLDKIQPAWHYEKLKI